MAVINKGMQIQIWVGGTVKMRKSLFIIKGEKVMGLFGNRQKKRDEKINRINTEMELALIKQEIVNRRREQIMAKVYGEDYDPEELRILERDFEKADDLTMELKGTRSTDEFLDRNAERILILKRKYRE